MSRYLKRLAFFAAVVAWPWGHSACAEPAPIPSPDASTPAVTWHAGLREGVGVSSDDFSLSLGLLSQTSYEVTVADEVDHGFAVRMARPSLRFAAFEGLFTAFVQPELAGTPKLLDAQLGVHPLPELELRFGQFITPHSRAFMTPVPKLQFVDFGSVESEFRAGRDMGIGLYGALFGGDLEYAAGVFNGNGIEPRFGHGYMAVARLTANPFGAVPYDETIPLAEPEGPLRLALSWNGYLRAREREEAGDQRDVVLGPDLLLVYRGFTVLAEGYRRMRSEHGQSTEAWGAYVQAGCFVVPQLVELAGRVSGLDLDIARPGQTRAVYEAALHVYPVGNHLKVHARYAHARGDALPAEPDHRVTIQTQLHL